MLIYKIPARINNAGKISAIQTALDTGLKAEKRKTHEYSEVRVARKGCVLSDENIVSPLDKLNKIRYMLSE